MNLFKRNLVKKYFSKADLDGVGNAVAMAEDYTSAEIRVKIISKIDKGLKGDIYKQAVLEFEKEGMTKTRDQTGALILVALKDKKFQILADKGIMAKVKQEVLDKVANLIKTGFQSGKQKEGLCFAVGYLGGILGGVFPRKPDDKNELPNDVVVETDGQKFWRGQKILTEGEAFEKLKPYGPEPDETKKEEKK